MSIPSLLSLLSIPAFLFAAFSSFAASGDATKTPASSVAPVAVDGGVIRGVASEIEGVRVYKGIPYAAPPVGNLRWKPPQPVVPWNGVRECSKFGPACPQPDSKLLPVPGRQDENCLYLNVWAPAGRGEGKRPVMVWIHGGGHTTGAGSMPLYDGSNFAADGVVLVTFNYRLGPLGYLAHPALSAESPHHVSGNYGTLDQIAALKWVHRNIAKFGGDPGNVTVFGESAGAVSCGVLLIAPQAKGLFERAILESGTPAGIRTPLSGGLDSAEALGDRLFEKLGVKTLAEARAKSPRELIDALPPVVSPFARGTKYGPIVDGWVIPEEPLRLMEEGKFQSVPVLIGTNADEGNLFLGHVPIKHKFGYGLLISRIYGKDADAVLKLFPANVRGTPKDSLSHLLTVASFISPARMWARWVAARQPNVYLYQFTRVSPKTASFGMGATHGFEIPYVFENGKQFLSGPIDKGLSQSIHRYWIRFATTGDPNGPGLPDWPRYTASGDRNLEFGDTIQVEKGLEKAGCDLFARVTLERAGVEATAGGGQ